MANTLYDYYTGQGQKLPSIAERSTLYEKAGLGSASTYQGTAAQNTSLLKSLQAPMTQEDFSAPDIAFPNAPTSNVDTIMSGINASNTQNQQQLTAEQERIKEYQKQYQDAQMFQGVAPEQAIYDASVQGLTDLQAQSLEKSKRQAELYQTGTSELQKRLNELNIQSAQLQGSYLQGLTSAEGRVAPMSAITGQQAQIQRQYATQAASVALEQQALQGNIENARAIADQMVQLEFGDIEQQIAYQKDIINLNYDNLTRAEKKRADELNFILNQRQAEIDEKKEVEMNKNNLMIQMAQTGASGAALDKIRKAETLTEAIMAAAPYMSTTENGNWSLFEDAEGNKMMFDKNTGSVKNLTANTGSNSNVFFTDANGTAWNIEGWATDPTKAQQMQSIADRIGKVTDENLEAKAKQFTPGLTADMIREASAHSGVSWEALMTMVNQESLGGTSNVAKKNNNYGGLTFNNQSWIEPYGGTKGSERPASEGGNYIKFPTPQQGLNAMAALMSNYGTVIPEKERVDSEVQSYVELVNRGEYTSKQAIDSIDKTKKVQLLEALAYSPKQNDTAADEELKLNAQEAVDLKNHKGFDSSVGYALGRKALVPWRWDDKDDFIASVDKLTKNLTLEKLIEAKSRGATFGALSDKEMQVLDSAASKIGTWRVVDKNGKTTGYKIGHNQMKKELDEIARILNKTIKNSLDLNIKTMPDGSAWQLNADGTLTQI